MTLSGGIKCTEVSAILPSSGSHEEITSSLFVVVCHFENVLKMLLARAKNLRARVCNSYERKVTIHPLGSERLKLED